MCQDTLMCVVSGWVLPQGAFLEGLVGDSRKEIVMRDSEGGNQVDSERKIMEFVHC